MARSLAAGDGLLPGPPAEAPETLAGALRVFLRHRSPQLLIALTLAAGLGRVLAGPPSLADAAVAAAVLALWPLQEWLIHVFVLHYRPRRVLGRRLDFRVPRLHRAHHRDPWRLEWIFIPTHVFLYAPLLTLGVFALLLPSPPLLATGLLVYFGLSLHYEWVHFLVHTRYRPRSRLYRRLRRNHLLHHFRNEHYWFGVTMLAGDRLLGTAPDARLVPSSPTARRLHTDPRRPELDAPEPRGPESPPPC